MTSWNDLSIKEKAAMMKVAVQNGITTLPEIKKAYNKFAGGGEYTVQKGDTLSHIARRLTGNANNWRELAEYNNLDNPNLILVGQQIRIPEKYDRPLDYSEIPTRNEVKVIDDYSPNFKYIVEDDKVYYSRKDRNDYWVDISDNDKARRNLLAHENKKGFEGYDDNERNIFEKMQNGSFNYPQYHDSLMTAYLNPSNPYNPNEYDTNRKKRELTPEDAARLEQMSQDLQEPSNYVAVRDATSFVPTPVWQDGSGQSENKDIYDFRTVTDTSSTQPVKRERPKEEQEFFDRISGRLSVDPLVQEASSVARPIVYEYRQKEEQPEEPSWVDKVVTGISDLYEMGRNYIGRQFQKRVNDNDPVSTLKLPDEQSLESDYGIIPQTYTGDTIQVNGRRYILPESVDLNNIKLGVRNRGEDTTLESEGAIITNFNGYKPASSYSGNGTYMGIDKDGNFKVGSLSDFNPDDLVTRTYANKVTSFAVDGKGNQRWKDDAAHGNPGRSVPVVNVQNEDGSITEGSINILTSKNQKDSNTYGNITGGRVVMEAGNERRLVSGSIDDLKTQFEDMKRRHNADYVTFYTLDNGSYNRGLRTKDKILTSADLHAYDRQNSGGGNFMYIIDKQGYPSDTLLTPNVRTENDESYKKGHPLTNEQKGIVLHHTAFMEPDLTAVVNHLRDPKSEASSHVVIGYNGERRVLAEPSAVTFHAGSSVWNNRDNVNDFMLGIEFQGDTNRKDLTDAQIESAIEYMLPIIRENNIPLENIVTHQQVRDMYNEFARKQKQKQAPSKPDINFANYERIINELKRRIYYKKAFGGPLVQTANKFLEGGDKGNPKPITTSGAGYIPALNTNRQLFNREKIYNRVLPTEMTGENTGPIASVREYLFNKDDAVDKWFEKYAPYRNATYDDILRTRYNIGEMYDSLPTDEAREELAKTPMMQTLENKAQAPEMFVQEDGKDVYLGMPQRFGTMMNAEYAPTNGKLINGKYVSYMRDPAFIENEILASYNDYINGVTREQDPGSPVAKITENGNAVVQLPFLNNATMSKGYDPERGEYISIYDDWDYNTKVFEVPGDNISTLVGGRPFSIYDRYYLNDIYGLGKNDTFRGRYLPEVIVTPDNYAMGGPLVQLANRYDGTTQPTQQMYRMKVTPNTVRFKNISLDPTGATYNIANELDVTPWNNPDDGSRRIITLEEMAQQADMNKAINEGMNKAGKVGAAAMAVGLAPYLYSAVAPVAASAASTASSTFAPGSAFWASPLTQQMMVSTLGGETINTAVKQFTPFNTVGEGLSKGVETVTGWNPSSTILGSLVMEGLNPGYYTPYNAAAKGINYAVNTAKIVDPKYRALHAYNSVNPTGYDNIIQRGTDWLLDMVQDNPVDFKYPKFYKDLIAQNKGIRPESGYTGTGDYIGDAVKNRGLIADEARLDAWAIHNGLEPQYGTYIKNSDGSWSYNMKNIIDKSEGTWYPSKLPLKTKTESIDFVTGAGGGLTDFRLVGKGSHGNGIMHLEDYWDVNPFKRKGDVLSKRLFPNWDKHIGNKLWTKALNMEVYGVENPETLRGKIATKLSKKLYDASEKPLFGLLSPIDNAIKNFEIGTITGGKPFLMSTDIPFHKINPLDNPDMLTQFMQGKRISTNPADIYKYGYNPDYVQDVKPIIPDANFKNMLQHIEELRNPTHSSTITHSNQQSYGGPLVQLANRYAMGGPENDLVDRVIQEEGFLAKPTNIGDGKMTLGSGLTASKWHKLYNQKGEWTEEDNQKAVAEELEERRKWAEKDVPNWDKLPQDSQNALLSYKYNFDFNRNNSPKLYKALSEGNFEEAARQMDATSSNPKFKKGLQARRQREQEWFLKGLEQIAKEAQAPIEQVAENASVYNPPQSVIDNIIANNGKYMITGTPPLAGTRIPTSGIADGLAMQDKMANIWRWIRELDMFKGLFY